MTTLPTIALAEAMAALAARVRPSVVAVRSRNGGGAGTIWRADGLIVTNNHVLPRDGGGVEVVFGEGVLSARIAARDASLDLAALRVDATGLPAVTPGDSARLRPGHLVFAIGNPWGEAGVVTGGVVLARTPLRDDAGREPLGGAIRADVRLAPGNSGGPLADARGHVVGINAMIAGGVAVAIPATAVATFLADEGGDAGFLGIVARPVPIPGAIAAALPAGDGAGLLVTELTPGGAAEAAGFLPGDIVVAVEGGPRTVAAIVRGLRALRAGQPTRFELLRGGLPATIEATPAAAPPVA